MKTYPLVNTFHRTSVGVRPTFNSHGEAILSHRQMLRAQRALCGISDCVCGAYGVQGGMHWIDLDGRGERSSATTYNLHVHRLYWGSDTRVKETP